MTGIWPCVDKCFLRSLHGEHDDDTNRAEDRSRRPAHRLGPHRALGRQRPGGWQLSAGRVRLRVRGLPGARDRRPGACRATCSSRATSASSSAPGSTRDPRSLTTFSATVTESGPSPSPPPTSTPPFESAVRHGASAVASPSTIGDDAGSLRTASIATYGSTRHSFIDRHADEGCFAPGFSAEGLPHARRASLSGSRGSTTWSATWKRAGSTNGRRGTRGSSGSPRCATSTPTRSRPSTPLSAPRSCGTAAI